MNDRFRPGLFSRVRRLRKVALVRASRIGDFVCATPAFRALRTTLPDAEITLLALPIVRELSGRSAAIDRFVPFPGFPGIAEQFFNARQVVRFFDRMQAEKFDLALQMHGTGVYSNTFTLMLGARLTAGFVREGDDAGNLDAAFVMPATGHEVDRLLALMTFLGADSADRSLEFPLWEKDIRQAGVMLSDAKRPLFGLHPHSRKAEKCWPPERYAEAAVELRKRHGGTIILLGGSDHRDAAARVAGLIGQPCVDLTGNTPLGTLGAVILRLAVLLTNDSGPGHIAYALGTPAVTLFGETDPDRWGPPSDGPFRSIRRVLPCFPCEEGTCASDYACLRTIPVGEVVSAASDVMRR
jgi:ADP-heptose:LPS heptosyltransferase